MNIPNLPTEKLALPDGSPHPAWFQTLTQLTTQMQQNLSDEGYVVPQQSTSNISTISSGTQDVRFLFDNQTNELKLLVNGTVLTVQTA